VPEWVYPERQLSLPALVDRQHKFHSLEVGTYQTRIVLHYERRHVPSYPPHLPDLLPPRRRLPLLARLGASAYVHVRVHSTYDYVQNEIDAHDHEHDAHDDYCLTQIDDAPSHECGRHFHSSLSSKDHFQSPSGNVELVPRDALTR
jgi:hypothetical protein